MDQQISEQLVTLDTLMQSRVSGSNNFSVASAEAVIMDVINYIKSFELDDLPVGASHVVTSARSLTSMLEAGEFKDSADAELGWLHARIW